VANPFDQFDASAGNPFDEFDNKPKPAVMGQAANADFLKAELANADWGTRNIAGFGTALSDLYEGAKQLFGKGDLQRIRDNKVIAEAAPVGAIGGNVAMTAIPFGLAGNSLNAAAKVGTVMGALNPVDSENARDIVAGKILGAATGGATAAAGQGIANDGARFFERRAADQALKQATNAPIDQTIKDAVDAGFVVTPSSVNSSWMNALREGASGKVATAQEASTRNAAAADALARKALGLAPDAPLTSEAMQALRDQAHASGYAPLAKMGELPVSDEYGKALDSIIAGRADAARSFPGADSPDLRALVESYKPQGDKWAPAAIRDDVLARVKGLIDKVTGSRTSALQEAGKLQTEAAQATSRANDFVPVPGMPRVPARLSENLDRAAEYSAAVPDALGIMAKRTAQRDSLKEAADLLSGMQLPKASFDAGDAIQATRVLRQEAKDAFRKGDTAVGSAKVKISNEIENEIERQLTARGADGADMLKKFQDARKLMAKSHDVENAIVEGGGTIDARKIGAMLQRGAPLSDELRVIGAFANNFPKPSSR
jgi:hypothetical protein